MTYKDIPKNQCLIISPDRIKVLMSGVAWIEQNRRGRVTLVYTDGSRETANVEPKMRERLADAEYFSIVSAVQSQRKQER